ncbi:uncharacterized protein LOC135165396 [Diachasmimorpha longicaudata]|uniref:uncharacterized protein LOC135165396 n=1 Tax=Diachasmimorpha longicaudata TaxID=58733 RepID=UPI0030B8F871
MRYQRLRQSRRRAMTSLYGRLWRPRPGVILATALASLVLRDGASHEVRMLLDTGSELSFATRELVKKLSLPTSPAVLPVVGISGSTSASNGFSQFSLKSLHSNKQILVKAYVLDSLTSSLPSFSASQPQQWKHLRGLQLADPRYLTSRPVDLLIGADFFGSIVEPQIIKGPSDSPIAMLSLFGWVVLGPTSAVTSAASSHHVSVSNEELSELLTSFWQQEEVSAAEGKGVALTREEAECEEFFQRTHTRDRSGRYIVRLPLVRSPAELGDSLGRAKACLASLLRRLEKGQGSLQLYSDFLKEYEELGHMVRVPAMPVSTDSRILDRQPGEMTLAHGASASTLIVLRVTVVQELVQQASWRYVSGKENPADCASRGISVAQLNGHHLWWTGPKWLRKEASQWPSGRATLDPSTDLEEKPGLTLAASLGRSSLWDLCSRYSSLYKLLRITAICQTVVGNMLRKLERKRGIIVPALFSPGSMEAARLYWVKATQAHHLQAECDIISHGLQLKKSHPLTKLTAFIDQQGVLRVGGRLKFSTLGPESRHQAIIPQGSVLAELIIRDSHQRTLHGGTQLTLAHLRRSYWIIGGRLPVKSFILKCVECARHRGIRAQQLMGQLPVARLVSDRAFSNTGVDYAGPVSLKTWRGRGHKTQKGWLVIFVCMATSALHLEAVTDYTADGFIAAYRRFVSRRGYCRHLYSDCGTNFIGADKELKKLFSAGAKEFQHLSAVCLKDGTCWSFNPPGAPHFGGKWEAAVKSVKYHLARTVRDTALTFEELSTLLSQIEAVLNSRPLQPLSEDPDDVSCLTPGHFLIGEAPIALPEPSLEHLNVGRLSRWQLIQQRLQFFWKQWSTGYLQQLQSISKWHHPSNEIKVGSLVLLYDERFPPAKWPLARVTALHPGRDGLSRVVTIRTASTTLTRPISKLVSANDLYSFCVSNGVPDGGENVEATASCGEGWQHLLGEVCLTGRAGIQVPNCT